MLSSQKNTYAKDDCLQIITIDITAVAISYLWEKNHKYNLAEYLVEATDGWCGVGEYWSVRTIYVEYGFDEYNKDVEQQDCNGFDENCDGIADDFSEDRSLPVIYMSERITLTELPDHLGKEFFTLHCSDRSEGVTLVLEKPLRQR